MDSVVHSVITAFQRRAEFGQRKYGTNLDRTDLSTLEWIQHAQEEAMDFVLYLEKLKQLHQPKIQFRPESLQRVASPELTNPERQRIADLIGEIIRENR
jgi:hypothetical protein